MTTDIGTGAVHGRLLVPAAGWTEHSLPSGPGNVIQYRNNQGSRVVAALGCDGYWKVLCTNIHQTVHFFAWEASRVVADLADVTAVEIIAPPARGR